MKRKFLFITGVSALALSTFAAGFILAKKVVIEFDGSDDKVPDAEEEVTKLNLVEIKDRIKRKVMEGYEAIYATPQDAAQALIPEYEGPNRYSPYRNVNEFNPHLYQNSYVSTDRAADKLGVISDTNIYEQLIRSTLSSTGELPVLLKDIPIDEDIPDMNMFRESKIYIVTENEYIQGERDYNQATFTWYEGDDVLTDQDDTVIENVDRIVGRKNLLFGLNSNDANVVYIRNEHLEYDYEVIRSTGSYGVDVLGLERA